ncbi:MAG: acetyl-CoA carboxylase biotin carboxyl carrier protein [Candidatus Korobacteraceae bacterium]
MNQKEIKELIEFLVEKDIAEFELQRGDVKLLVKRGTTSPPTPVVHVAPTVLPAPIVSSTAPAPAPAPEIKAPAPPSSALEPDLFILKSPIVGTYYEAPSPGTPPFVKVGDTVKEGQVLCIIEAMKLMNEIEADVSGVIAKMFVPNGSPVEYGMPLFGIKRT